MRRSLAIGAAFAVLVVSVLAGSAGAAEPGAILEANARGSVWAGLLDVQPSLDPAFADSISTSSTVGTSSRQSIVWPSFLGDAFFFLYDAQPYERTLMAISEARWPQGPEISDATLSTRLPGAEALPGRGGRSVARADERGASGDVAVLATAPAEGSIVGEIAAASDVLTSGRIAAAHAVQSVSHLAIGPLTVRLVRGEVTAEAGRAATPTVASELVIAGAEVGGIPVEITEEGARAGANQLQGVVDTLLGDRGLAVRMLPATQEIAKYTATASSGGMLVDFRFSAEDPLGTPRNVAISMLFGSASASARAEPLPDLGAPLPEAPTVLTRPPVTTTITVPGSSTPAFGAAPLIRRRTVITSAIASDPADARGLYGAVVLAALGLLLVRPLVRAVSRA